MKRFTALFLTCLLLMLMTFAGCNKTNNIPSDSIITPTKSVNGTIYISPTPAITDDPNANVFNVYSFTEELSKIVSKYKELHPDFPYKIEYFSAETSDAAYQPFLDLALATGGKDTPDIYGAESAFVLNYTQGEAYHNAAPYENLGIDVDNLIKEADIAQYSIDIGTNPEGKLIGLSYQGTGGAFIYRRSIAKKVWGTDDPAAIKAKIGPGWDKFFEVAADLKAKGYGIVSGDGDIWHSVENSSDEPWVIDGKLNIDPKREAFLDYAKLLKERGYDNNTLDWTDDWYADMKGAGAQQIFGFFGPAWFISYLLPHYSGGDKLGEGTYGDWAICEPPAGFFWGGTWVFANKATKKKAVVGDIIEWITLDSSDTGFQYIWANGSMKELGGVKDAVTSGTVMKKSDGKLDILSGQNMFEVFYPAGKLAIGKNITRYDAMMNVLWLDQVREYTAGNKTRDQAIADFKKNVKDILKIAVE